MNAVTVKAATTATQTIVLGATTSITLIALLTLKELLSAYAAEPHVTGTRRSQAVHKLSTVANVAILPLIAIFGMIVLVRILSLV